MHDDKFPDIRVTLRTSAPRQPNGWTCGPTCLTTLMHGLRLACTPEILDIAARMGANPTTGTTEVEMQRGLTLCGLSARRPLLSPMSHVEAAAYLAEQLAAGDVVVMRTLMNGCKHWVLVTGCEDDAGGFLVVCPSSGKFVLDTRAIHAIWQARDFDHFLVSAQLSRHPEAARVERDLLLRRAVPVAALTLDAFMGGHPIIPDDQWEPVHHRMVNDAAYQLRVLHEDGAPALALAYDALPSFSFRVVSRPGRMDTMLLVDGAGILAGGISDGTRWIEPAFRGEGLGAELVLAAYDNPQFQFLRPHAYSEAGHASRVRAHALAVERAYVPALQP